MFRETTFDNEQFLLFVSIFYSNTIDVFRSLISFTVAFSSHSTFFIDAEDCFPLKTTLFESVLRNAHTQTKGARTFSISYLKKGPTNQLTVLDYTATGTYLNHVADFRWKGLHGNVKRLILTWTGQAAV